MLKRTLCPSPPRHPLPPPPPPPKVASREEPSRKGHRYFTLLSATALAPSASSSQSLR